MSTNEDARKLPWIWSEGIVANVLKYCDRATWNRLRLTSTAFNSIATQQPCSSWPETRLRVDSGCFCLSFSPDGNYLACTSLYGRVLIWHKSRGSIAVLLHPCSVVQLEFSSNGQRLAVLCPEGRDNEASAWIWDIHSLSIVRTCIVQHRADLVAFSPDGNYFLYTYKSSPRTYTINKVHIYEKHLEYVYNCRQGVRRPIISPSGNILATLTFVNPHYNLQLWTFGQPQGAVGRQNGRLILHSSCQIGGDGHLVSILGFSQTGKYLAVYHNRAVLLCRPWDKILPVSKLHDKSTFGSAQVYLPLASGFMQTWREPISFLPNESAFVSWSSNLSDIVSCWSIDSGKIVSRYKVLKSANTDEDDRVVKMADNQLLTSTGGSKHSSGQSMFAMADYSSKSIYIRCIDKG